MRILGIDPALRITGYGIVQSGDDGISHIASGTITTNSSSELRERLDTLYNGVMAVIGRFRPDVMAIEKVFVHNSHTTTAFLLGQARGTIILAAAHNSLPVIEYAATEVKKAVTGRGHATKQQIQRMVMSILGMRGTPRHLDITDALALALTHRFHNSNPMLAQALGRTR